MEGKRGLHVSKTRGHIIYVFSASDGIAATQKAQWHRRAKATKREPRHGARV